MRAQKGADERQMGVIRIVAREMSMARSYDSSLPGELNSDTVAGAPGKKQCASGVDEQFV